MRLEILASPVMILPNPYLNDNLNNYIVTCRSINLIKLKKYFTKIVSN